MEFCHLGELTEKLAQVQDQDENQASSLYAHNVARNFHHFLPDGLSAELSRRVVANRVDLLAQKLGEQRCSLIVGAMITD